MVVSVPPRTVTTAIITSPATIVLGEDGFVRTSVDAPPPLLPPRAARKLVAALAREASMKDTPVSMAKARMPVRRKIADQRALERDTVWIR